MDAAFSSFEVREIPHGSEAYAATCRLRHEVLRKPLGMDLFAEELGLEKAQFHFGLFERATLVACLVVVPLGNEKVRLRQMAVSPERQRQGLGGKLMRAVEITLAGKGFRHVELHARLSAEGFYRRLGYQRHGTEFIEVGIPHVAMDKALD